MGDPRRGPLGILFVLALGLLAVDAVITFFNVRAIEHAGAEVARSREVIVALERVLSLLKDAETGQRGFLLTGEEDYLKPSRDAAMAIDAQLGRVAALTADNPEKQARVDSLRRASAEKLRELERAIAVRRQGDPERALDLLKSGRGTRAMDEARRLAAELGAREGRSLARREATSRLAVRRTVGAFALLTALAFSLLLVAWVIDRGDRGRSDRHARGKGRPRRGK